MANESPTNPLTRTEGFHFHSPPIQQIPQDEHRFSPAMAYSFDHSPETTELAPDYSAIDIRTQINETPFRPPLFSWTPDYSTVPFMLPENVSRRFLMSHHGVDPSNSSANYTEHLDPQFSSFFHTMNRNNIISPDQLTSQPTSFNPPQSLGGFSVANSLAEVREPYNAGVWDSPAIESARTQLSNRTQLPNYGAMNWTVNTPAGDSVPSFSNNAPSRSEPVRKKASPWTKNEHMLFLAGLKQYGKGRWRSISKHFVVTKTPTQVASHAQKFYLRQDQKSRKRPSIHDINNVDENLANSSLLQTRSLSNPNYISISQPQLQPLPQSLPQSQPQPLQYSAVLQTLAGPTQVRFTLE